MCEWHSEILPYCVEHTPTLLAGGHSMLGDWRMSLAMTSSRDSCTISTSQQGFEVTSSKVIVYAVQWPACNARSAAQISC
mmetsp:Transcript_34746/g.69217  ORF Transcript_34746/g.69217 Transcript_34746/m.69217 type:complete len:80 (+) Transcript_34746:587-826(+)